GLHPPHARDAGAHRGGDVHRAAGPGALPSGPAVSGPPHEPEAMTMAKAKMKAQAKTAKARTTARARRKPAARRKAARPVRTQPETLRLRGAAPSFTVSDIARSVAWYRDVLGLVVKDRWEHDGKLAGAEMVGGSVTFYLGQDDWKKG